MCWNDGTLLEVVRYTLTRLPSNDKGLLSEFLNEWFRASICESGFWDITDTDAAKNKCEKGFDKWQSVFVSNPEFTMLLLRKVVVDSSMAVRAIRLELDDLREEIEDYQSEGKFSKDKHGDALIESLNKINHAVEEWRFRSNNI